MALLHLSLVLSPGVVWGLLLYLNFSFLQGLTQQLLYISLFLLNKHLPMTASTLSRFIYLSPLMDNNGKQVDFNLLFTTSHTTVLLKSSHFLC